jgi:hypothetical protein
MNNGLQVRIPSNGGKVVVKLGKLVKVVLPIFTHLGEVR